MRQNLGSGMLTFLKISFRKLFYEFFSCYYEYNQKLPHYNKITGLQAIELPVSGNPVFRVSWKDQN